MKKIEIVPRIRIDGKYYTFDQLPKEKVDEIIEQRVDLAMAGINYERCVNGTVCKNGKNV
ncbi:MAG: hypothetical protein Q4D16_12485 [Eubacteriales bacterium]|nr:hypothetical protein [Eubacteriales bacterium]